MSFLFGCSSTPAFKRPRASDSRPYWVLSQLPLSCPYKRICRSSRRALSKSPLGAAIGYALRNWVALTRYAEDGRLKIDNNGAEQALLQLFQERLGRVSHG
jgi:Transposase IS66 family